MSLDKRYREPIKPSKGRGHTQFYPGQWMTLKDVLEFLGGISAPTMHKIRRSVLTDPLFKKSGLTMIWLRRPGYQTDFASATYMLQRIKGEEALKKKERTREKTAKTYYDRELKAYLDGKLKTGPRRHNEAILSVRLDPFKS